MGQAISGGRFDRLLQACSCNDTNEVLKLLAEDREMIKKHHKTTDCTALIMASACGSTETVELLLGNSADPNQADRNNLAGLHMAAFGGHLGCVRVLLGAGAKYSLAGGDKEYTPLHWAANEGKEEICRALLECGANPHQADINNNSPLSLAANNNKRLCVRELVTRGSNPFLKNKFGFSAITLLLDNERKQQDFEDRAQRQAKDIFSDPVESFFVGGSNPPPRPSRALVSIATCELEQIPPTQQADDLSAEVLKPIREGLQGRLSERRRVLNACLREMFCGSESDKMISIVDLVQTYAQSGVSPLPAPAWGLVEVASTQEYRNAFSSFLRNG